MEANSRDIAISILQGKGLVPLVIEQVEQIPKIIKDLQHLWNGVNLHELSIFFRQLATLIEAKVSIVTSLRAVGEQTSNAYLKIVTREMINDIEDGVPFSETMAKHPDVFQPLAISMIKAGELSGNLQRSILFLAENTEKNSKVLCFIRCLSCVQL